MPDTQVEMPMVNRNIVNAAELRRENLRELVVLSALLLTRVANGRRSLDKKSSLEKSGWLTKEADNDA